MNLLEQSREVLRKQLEDAYLAGVRQKPLDYRERADQILTSWLTLAATHIRENQ